MTGEQVTLTEAEREKLENSLRWHFNVVASEGAGSAYATAGIQTALNTVDRIIAARLAEALLPAQGLAQQWSLGYGPATNPDTCKDFGATLTAALGAEAPFCVGCPDHEGCATGWPCMKAPQ